MRGRPRKVARTVPEPGSEDVTLQRQAILRDDERLDEAEDVYHLLADQSQMLCSDWEHAQDAEPVIKRMKELIEEFADVAPNDVQLGSEGQGG